MPGSRSTGPVGSGTTRPDVDDGTMARTASPPPVPVGSTPAGAAVAAASPTDPQIEALNLRGAAKAAAYALKKAHPSVRFTSGRRSKADQARAMGSNVVHNRKWIGETYSPGTVSTACQKWVDANPSKKTQDEIAAGLLSVMNAATDDDVAKLSRHLSGDAFDVQPVVANAEAIKKTIRGLAGLNKFLDKEGGLVRWHAQF